MKNENQEYDTRTRKKESQQHFPQKNTVDSQCFEDWNRQSNMQEKINMEKKEVKKRVVKKRMSQEIAGRAKCQTIENDK